MTRIRWSIRAYKEIRRSPEVVAELRRRTERVREGCGDGYVASVEQGRTRARGNVAAWSFAARADNATNNTLLRNLDRGRL